MPMGSGFRPGWYSSCVEGLVFLVRAVPGVAPTGAPGRTRAAFLVATGE